jgi:two-component system, OmpR family, sensor kinase
VSIRLRLTLFWAAITAAILTAAGLLIMFSFAREIWGTLDAALLEEADTSAAALSHSGLADAAAIVHHLAEEKDLGPGRRVRLIAGERIILDQGDQNTELPKDRPAQRRAEVLEGGGHRYRFAVVPLMFDGQPAWLEDGVDAGPVRRDIARLRRTLLFIIPIILVLCVVGGYWLSGRALAPVNEVTAALARIGARDLRQRLPAPRVHDEARRLVDAINQLLTRLEQAAAAQQRFVSEAAHELRTPLTVLRSGLEVALRRPRSAEENRAAMADALGEVEGLCSTAEDLLALARIEAERIPNHEIVDLKALIDDACAAARTLADSKGQTLAVKAGTAPAVRGNSRELQRLVLNLLDNAIKFTPEQGRIEVALACHDGSALLSVCDNGPGVKPDELCRMFDPFYRSRGANAAGSGLGLALCHEIVVAHGGDIKAANRAGGGCEVQVRLPVAAA